MEPAIQLFVELGWATVTALEELFRPNGALGRETMSEVVLSPKPRSGLDRLIPALPAFFIPLSVYR